MTNQNQAQQTMAQINHLLTQDGNADLEKQWLEQQAEAQPELLDAIRQLTTQDFRVIAEIDRAQEIHIKALPALTALSQPTISRIITRFTTATLLEKYQKPDNKKDFLVRLTPLGQQVADLHRHLDQQLLTQVANILDAFPDDEVTHFNQMLTKIGQIQPELYGYQTKRVVHR
ncbi:MarR family winged helix-turn-helix transcriptional regulator [Furfurilactobacillus entadae]|uniref:MarR family winged helix-turn-helix transcriptional regulator n=1 Tax=Furfurilactobacillus entadae TaxID=2922307 RepID=UPI0035EF1187